MTAKETHDGFLDFYASKDSPLALARRYTASGFVIAAISLIFVLPRDVSSLPLTLGLLFVMFCVSEYFMRRQLRVGEALVTLSDAFIVSPILSGKAKQIAWTDVSAIGASSMQGTPVIEFSLRGALGAYAKRSFWTGVNSAKPYLPVAAFSVADQERLLDEILRRHSGVAASVFAAPITPPKNELREEREFQDSLHNMQPRTWGTYSLIAINVLIWVFALTQGGGVMHSSAENLFVWGANSASAVQQGEWWRMLSSMFLHSGIVHVAMNMLGLYYVGQPVERIYGTRQYLLIYLGAGLLGSAMSLYFSAQIGVSVGASGAVFGVVGALWVAVFQHKDKLPKVFTSRTVKGLGLFVVYSLIQGFGTKGIDNAAHIGGLLGGALIAFILPEKFDMASYLRTYKSRAAAAILVAVCALAGLAVMAPRANIDQAQLVANALQKFKTGKAALEIEASNIKSGKLSAHEADERSRTVFAPMFREVMLELSPLSFAPNDPRASVVADLLQVSKLLVETLAMESKYNPATKEYDSVDPDRSAELAAEMRVIGARMAAAVQKEKAKP